VCKASGYETTYTSVSYAVSYAIESGTLLLPALLFPIHTMQLGYNVNTSAFATDDTFEYIGELELLLHAMRFSVYTIHR